MKRCLFRWCHDWHYEKVPDSLFNVIRVCMKCGVYQILAVALSGYATYKISMDHKRVVISSFYGKGKLVDITGLESRRATARRMAEAFEEIKKIEAEL